MQASPAAAHFLGGFGETGGAHVSGVVHVLHMPVVIVIGPGGVHGHCQRCAPNGGSQKLPAVHGFPFLFSTSKLTRLIEIDFLLTYYAGKFAAPLALFNVESV